MTNKAHAQGVKFAHIADYDLLAVERILGCGERRTYIERYSKPHVIEKKKRPRAASNASW